jgi:drug/metabolite transporter (DMT)-like permease
MFTYSAIFERISNCIKHLFIVFRLKIVFGNIAIPLSVVIWSAWLSILLQFEAVPPLLLVGLVSVAFGLLQAIEGAREKGFWNSEISIVACLFAAFGAIGSRVLTYSATVMIDPVDVASLCYLWLGLAIVFGQLLAGVKVNSRHYAGCFVLALGVIVTGLDGVEIWHVFAFIGGIGWAWFVAKAVYIEGFGKKAGAIGGIGAGGMLILLSFIAGESWDMSWQDWGWFGVLVVSTVGGVWLWIFGTTHGTERFAKVGMLFMPLIAVIWLSVLGGLSVGLSDFLAPALVTFGGLILSPHVVRAARTEGRHS